MYSPNILYSNEGYNYLIDQYFSRPTIDQQFKKIKKSLKYGFTNHTTKQLYFHK